MSKPVYRCSVCGIKLATQFIRQCAKCCRGRGGL